MPTDNIYKSNDIENITQQAKECAKIDVKKDKNAKIILGIINLLSFISIVLSIINLFIIDIHFKQNTQYIEFSIKFFNFIIITISTLYLWKRLNTVYIEY